MAAKEDKVLSEEDDNEEREEQSSISVSSTESIYESFEVSLAKDLHETHNKQILFYIVNEICSSEAKFVDTLRLLNVRFRNYIQDESKRIQWPTQINECIANLLKHLPHLQELNDYLLGELESAREKWLQTQKISHILVKIGPFLKHYSSYIKEFEHNQSQLNYCMRKWPQFAEKIHDFEFNEPMANRLCIQHHLLRPIQRIPQYRLLLEQYLHYLSKDDADYEDTVTALRVVSQVAEHANRSMEVELNFTRSLALQGKLLGGIRTLQAGNTCPLLQQSGCVFIRECELMKVSRKHLVSRFRRWVDSFRKSLGTLPVGACDGSSATDTSTTTTTISCAAAKPNLRKKDKKNKLDIGTE